MNVQKSMELWNKILEVVPLGVQTLSKSPNQGVFGAYPIFIDRGKGSKVYDVDGNEYIDYTQSLGPVTLGYSHPVVNKAIRDQLEKGIVFPLINPLELELATKLTEIIPCAEMVRFAKNGSDATTAAVRLARTCTGREKIAICGYHGWHDWFVTTTERKSGVPRFNDKLSLTFKYNDLESLRTLFTENKNNIAAVIMEPIGIVEPEPGFLADVKSLAHENGALLIYDEIITGFRMAMGGAQEYYGVTPDIGCFGKGMANGMPIAAIVGKKEYMERFSEVFFSFTFGGEALSIAASLATIRYLEEERVIPELWKKATYLKNRFHQISEQNGLRIRLIGSGPRGALQIEDHGKIAANEVKGLFLQEMAKRGVLMTFGVNLMHAHTQEDLDRTLDACTEALGMVAKAVAEGSVTKQLEGTAPQPVFRKA